MKVLVIGQGGREHALTWKLKQSPLISEIFCIPGNGGTAQISKNVDIDISDIEKIKQWAVEQKIDFTVVGPELPLSLGIVDAFRKAHLNIFGVNQKASQFEASKVFTKTFLQKYKIPTAKFFVAKSHEEAKEQLDHFQYPVVIKADGLAAGKGVKICTDKKEALHTFDSIFHKKIFGKAGEKVILEEFLEGEELSYIGFVNGKTFVSCPPSKDYKKVFDGDQGPNTGGMGAYSPVPWCDEIFREKIQHQVVRPVLDGFAKENIDYRGMLYIGLLVSKGVPYVLEFNVRFGDPEAQVILFKLKSDLLPILQAVSEGKPINDIEWDPSPTMCVVLASQGYPDSYDTGFEIHGLDSRLRGNDAGDKALFHSGTVIKDHSVFTNGGRVLTAVARGNTYKDAREKVYSLVSTISWKNMFYRKDIGEKLCHK